MLCSLQVLLKFLFERVLGLIHPALRAALAGCPVSISSAASRMLAAAAGVVPAADRD